MFEGVMYYHEVFASIQGESTDAGMPCVFVRLYGCNIGCSFCDQPQKKSDKKKISLGNLLSKITKYNIPYVCITGGEPMLQWDAVYPLVLELCSLGIKVSIETSGCVPIDEDAYQRSFKYIMDVKCPSSGVQHKNVLSNLMKLQAKDEVKFVVSNREDYEYAKKVIRTYPTMAKILFSPCFDENLKPMVGSELVDWILRDRLYNTRVQLQMHKFLNVR